MNKFIEQCKWLFRITKENFLYKETADNINNNNNNNKECVKIMSFNIRRDVCEDGDNNWQFRKYSIIEAIKFNNPDIICMQEVMPHMAKYINSKLSNYYSQESLEAFTWGDLTKSCCVFGEGLIIFYKKELFKCIKKENLKLYDGRFFNMRRALVVTLIHKYTEQPINIINTHLCHKSDLSRKKSCEKLLKYCYKNLNKNIFICGDFNCEVSQIDSGIDLFTNKFNYNIPDVEGTVNSFKKASGITIDFIFSDCTLKESIVDRYKYLQREFISDHWPVINTYTITKE